MKRCILLIVAALSVAGCGVCSEKKLAEERSPEGNYVAAVYERNCGATTDYVYHVNVRSWWSWFSTDYGGVTEDGQVFVTGKGKVNVVWKDEKTLLVECRDCPVDYEPKGWQRSWKDVSILYQPGQR